VKHTRVEVVLTNGVIVDEGVNGQILARDYFVYDGLGSC